ncbi:hypothetical protein AX761_24655 [Rhizobium sp. 58]|nr:hypothetical protein AX761_24655 [Rhizobium sp. 58]
MSDAILLERYKYVIDQKKRLNDATFKVAAFYQSILLVILAAQFRILELSQKSEINLGLTTLGPWGLFWAAFALTTLSLLLLAGGVASWFDYRKEEVLLEQQLGGKARDAGSFKGFLRVRPNTFSF